LFVTFSIHLEVQIMTDFMDTILSSFNDDVKQNNNKVLQTVQPIKEIPTYLNDPTIQYQPVTIPERIDYTPQLSEIAQVNYTFNSLLERSQRNILDDSFCSEKTKEIESRTESSFKKTFASYSRYISILQATT
jgi:hypothetical protein